MNEHLPAASTPPPIPQPSSEKLPLGEHPEDLLPIGSPMAAFEALLRHPRRVFHHLRLPGHTRVLGAFALIALLAAGIYGVVMGTFSGGRQLWAAPLKVAGGMVLCAGICLPSLYIFACLSGARARLVEVMGLVAGLLALTTVLLVGFAPVAWVFSQSTTSSAAMGTLHLVFWLIATLFGWRFLRSGFSHLHARSGGALGVWLMIFVLVCLQMTTALRPLIGTSDTLLPTQKKFFLTHWLEVIQESSNPEKREASVR